LKLWFRPLVVALLVWPAASQAASDAETLAALASETVDTHCAHVEQRDVTLAAESSTTVSQAWADISRGMETSNEDYLLYWRGVLEQCLGQDEKASDDLLQFIEQADGGTLRQQVRDAERRLKALAGKAPAARPPPRGLGGFVIGATLLGGAGATAGLAGWQWSLAQDVAQEMADGEHIGWETQLWVDDGTTAAQTSNALTATTVGLGAGGVAAVIVGVAIQAGGGSVAVVPMVAPTDRGWVVSIGGRW
jgi:hypothetical protein